MRRAKLRVLIAAVLAVAAPATAAQRHFGIQVQGGYAFPEENKHRGGVETGFGVVLPIRGRTSVRLEVMRWRVRSLGSDGKLYPGTVEIDPIAASLRFEFLRNQFFFPYAFAGAAFVFTRFEIGAVAAIPELRIDQEIDNGFAPYLGLGARLALTRTLSFTSEAAYLARTAPARTVFDDMNFGRTTRDIVANLRTVHLKFGLQWEF